MLCYRIICISNLIHPFNSGHQWKRMRQANIDLLIPVLKKYSQDKQSNDKLVVSYLYIKVSKYIKDVYQRTKYICIFILLLYCKYCPNFIHRKSKNKLLVKVIDEIRPTKILVYFQLICNWPTNHFPSNNKDYTYTNITEVK